MSTFYEDNMNIKKIKMCIIDRYNLARRCRCDFCMLLSAVSGAPIKGKS